MGLPAVSRKVGQPTAAGWVDSDLKRVRVRARARSTLRTSALIYQAGYWYRLVSDRRPLSQKPLSQETVVSGDRCL
eukprot:5911495-Heterocapsa_arctica.AAC.1